MNKPGFFLTIIVLASIWGIGWRLPLVSFDPGASVGKGKGDLVLKHIIKGEIRPKSVVQAGNGRFFAQNMMYRHSITVYDRNFNLVKTISDQVNLEAYNDFGYEGTYKGAPVDAAVSPDGKYVWVSNYKMYGKGFENPGQDNCPTRHDYDNSFLYKINAQSLLIESVIEVGSVPKYLKISPDGKRLLVANWCSGDVSIIDTETEKEIDRVYVGHHPRGIAIDSKSRYAYISQMGDDKIAILKLSDHSVSWIRNIGQTPRHLCIGPSDRFLYVALSREGLVAKFDLVKRKVVMKVNTGNAPRSMALDPRGDFLYVVNYQDHTLAKVLTNSMKIVQIIATHKKPNSVTFDLPTRSLWVACYTGSIMVFEDTRYKVDTPPLDLKEAGPLPPSSLKEDVAEHLPYVPGKPRETAKEDPFFYIYKEGKKEERPQNYPSAPSSPRNVVESSGNSVKQTETKEPTKELSAYSPPLAAGKTNSRSSVSSFHIIVGSFSSKANAMKLVLQLKRKGISADLLKESPQMYRVSCAKYDDETKAGRALRTYQTRYKFRDAWILKR